MGIPSSSGSASGCGRSSRRTCRTWRSPRDAMAPLLLPVRRARAAAVTTTAPRDEQLWSRCAGCAVAAVPQAAAPQPRRLPRVRRPCPARARRSGSRQLVDPDSFTPLPDRAAEVDPIGFVDVLPYPHRLGRGARRHRPGRGGRLRHRRHRRAPDRPGGDGLPLPRRQPRLRGRRADHPTAERALADEPLVLVTASGGARMQEGALSLMQMAHRQPGRRRAARGGPAHGQRDHRPDLRRGGRLVRHQHRRGARRERRADGLRRPPGDPPGHRAGRCRRASRPPSSCCATARSTWWCPGTRCAGGWPRCSPPPGTVAGPPAPDPGRSRRRDRAAGRRAAAGDGRRAGRLGDGAHWPGTRAGPPRWTTWRAPSTASSSCTATGSARTARRSSAGWPGSTAGR